MILTGKKTIIKVDAIFVIIPLLNFVAPILIPSRSLPGQRASFQRNVMRGG